MAHSTFRRKLEPTDLIESRDSRHHIKKEVPDIESQNNSADDVRVAGKFDHSRGLLAQMEAESQERSSETEKEVRHAEAHVRVQESMLQGCILEVISTSEVLREARKKNVLIRSRYMALRAEQLLIQDVVQRAAQLGRLGAVQPGERGVIAGRRGWPSVE